MRKLTDWIRAKYLCMKYGKPGCVDCPYYYDDGDWYGCTYNLKNHRK